MVRLKLSALNLALILMLASVVGLIAVVALVSSLGLFGSKQFGVGAKAPDFALKTPEGEVVRLSDFRGRVVVLDFFATWCGPCRLEIAHLKEVREAFGESVVIISISIRESPEAVSRFAKVYGMDWVVVIDERGDVALRYRVTAIPTIVIVDREGRVRFIRVGVTPAETLKAEVSKLLRG